MPHLRTGVALASTGGVSYFCALVQLNVALIIARIRRKTHESRTRLT